MTSPTTAAETLAINAFAVAALAVAPLSYTFEWRCGAGTMITVEVEAKVMLRDNLIQVHVVENAPITAKMCREFSMLARNAVKAALIEAGLADAVKAQTWTRDGAKLRQTGFWHMNQFCCSGRYSEFRIAAAA